MISLVSVRVYFVKDSGREKIVRRFRSVQRIFSLSKSMPNSPFLRVDMVRLLSLLDLVWVGLFVFYGIGSPPLNIIKRYDIVLIYYIISCYKLQS